MIGIILLCILVPAIIYCGYRAWTDPPTLKQLHTDWMFKKVAGKEKEADALVLQMGYLVMEKGEIPKILEDMDRDELAKIYAQMATLQATEELRQCEGVVQRRYWGVMGNEWKDLPKCEHADES